jgi:chromosomal replication initiator protein
MGGTIWDEVLGRIETKVNRYSYYTWFRQTSLAGDDGKTLTVRVTDPMVVDWLTKHYASVINEALGEVGRACTELRFRPDAPGPGGHAGPVQFELGAEDDSPGNSVEPRAVEPGQDAPKGPDGEAIQPGDAVGLSPRYSFETFIVGASNQFAHAACRAVAEAPSRSYNPLFLYGGVGLGKTHLMHAIGHYVMTHSPGLKLTYISAERFMNEVINAILHACPFQRGHRSYLTARDWPRWTLGLRIVRRAITPH